MKRLLFICLVLGLAHIPSYAQFPGNPDNPCEWDMDDAACDGDEPIPLDSGASILLIGGVLYGLKKIKEKNKLIKEVTA